MVLLWSSAPFSVCIGTRGGRCRIRGVARGVVRTFLLFATCLSVVLAACDSAPAKLENRPNIIWVVWDTVRSDRLSLYGHKRQTTPHLDKWAQGARVFENCVTPGSTTVPAHASMFTGLLPVQHGASNVRPRLDSAFQTIAEILREAGYATYAYSENPFITKKHNFAQGFDVAEEPSDPQYIEIANRITRDKMRAPEEYARANTAKPTRRRTRGLRAPEVLQQGVEQWLTQQDSDQPVFLFLNYMEAHWPCIPAHEYRQRLMNQTQARRSYLVDTRGVGRWLYTFGAMEFHPKDIEVLRLRYEAAILELDEHFYRLLQYLQAAGRLDNTIVILASDHGEQHGEHHMMEHQYSVYEPLARVPLVISYPPRIKPGRDDRPVMLCDLFPTLLELVGLDPPEGLQSPAVSLLAPLEQRPRLSEYPAVSHVAFNAVRRMKPGFDCTPWDRSLRAYYHEPYKFIRGSDGRCELYDIVADPVESRDLISEKPDVAKRLASELEALVCSLEPLNVKRDPLPELPLEHLQRLRALGYAGESADANEQDGGKTDREP